MSNEQPQPITVNNSSAAGAYDDVRTLVGMARLEAKLDVAIAHQGAKIAHHDDRIEDHELRLRAKEAESVISPKGLWTVVLGAVGAATGLVASGIIPIR